MLLELRSSSLVVMLTQVMKEVESLRLGEGISFVRSLMVSSFSATFSLFHFFARFTKEAESRAYPYPQKLTE